jgi:hypothetical protein
MACVLAGRHTRRDLAESKGRIGRRADRTLSTRWQTRARALSVRWLSARGSLRHGTPSMPGVQPVHGWQESGALGNRSSSPDAEALRGRPRRGRLRGACPAPSHDGRLVYCGPPVAPRVSGRVSPETPRFLLALNWHSGAVRHQSCRVCYFQVPDKSLCFIERLERVLVSGKT